MLKVENLVTRYGKKRILDDMSFALKKGETIAVIGESGTGKSTLGYAILGMLDEVSENASVEGKIEIDGLNINGLGKEDLRSLRWRKVSIVMQNVDDALNPTITVYKQIEEVLNKQEDRYKKITDMLKKIDFPLNRKDAYPHELSMGERQKILIAMAFIPNPEFVVLDEPTSSLDTETKNKIIEIIRKLSKDKAVILLTHDLDVAEELSNKTMVMYGGTAVEYAETQKIINNPKHPYSRGLIRSYPYESRTKDLQGIRGRAEFAKMGCPFYPRCTQAIDICRIQKPRLAKKDGFFIACHRGGIIPLIRMEKISKKFDNNYILKSVNLTLFEGETVTLLGKSGAGKTTLAKILMGLIDKDSGTIYLENNEVKKFDAEYYRKAQMIFQDTRSALSHRMKVLDIVMEPLIVQKLGAKQNRIDRAKKVLSEVELPTDKNFLNEYPHHLSGGEIQRIVIARSLVISPKLLIADEPTSALDASVQAKILKLLNNIQENRGLAILFITHDLGLAKKVSDRIVRIEDGIIN